MNGQIKKMHNTDWERAKDGRNLLWEASDTWKPDEWVMYSTGFEMASGI